MSSTYGKVSVKQNSKLRNLINYRIRVVTKDGKLYLGELMAFDKHMNVVLGDCVEERISKQQLQKIIQNRGKQDTSKENNVIKTEKRVLGLVILRGEQILSTVVEDKPVLTKKDRIEETKKQKKQLNNQKRARKGKTDDSKGKIVKPTSSNGEKSTYNANNTVIPGNLRKFQPPPGFKRK
ncbi:hypothetical protein TPHA_0D03410 [Tetrapisispora phaffii CBS 4417]|uniref:Sm protein B n=1 Tax=Tetrapisispora phaffii (strain ATCC 24235 / CBS 4417 / NBRC 1672 / NRRL Y-8282 / UCD 70-5) TaxID=1071381 RepID=G8BT05_TETPH|nr:hypothetical protein TPHA_0D03410 [Tetrapisispora phaffii CBS 4417]CCE62976.1 hypothetical protein TPHA_0D03410 [Tetrapisispora phaffii CBS 4417]